MTSENGDVSNGTSLLAGLTFGLVVGLACFMFESKKKDKEQDERIAMLERQIQKDRIGDEQSRSEPDAYRY